MSSPTHAPTSPFLPHPAPSSSAPLRSDGQPPLPWACRWNQTCRSHTQDALPSASAPAPLPPHSSPPAPSTLAALPPCPTLSASPLQATAPLSAIASSPPQ